MHDSGYSSGLRTARLIKHFHTANLTHYYTYTLGSILPLPQLLHRLRRSIRCARGPLIPNFRTELVLRPASPLSMISQWFAVGYGWHRAWAHDHLECITMPRAKFGPDPLKTGRALSVHLY